MGLTAAPAGSASASLVSRNRSSEGSARPGTNRHTRHNGDGTAPGCPTAPQPHSPTGTYPIAERSASPGAHPIEVSSLSAPIPAQPHIPTSPQPRRSLTPGGSSLLTEDPALCSALKRSRPPPTPPPALLLNRIHLACTVTLVIRDPSRAGLGLAACHGGILPPPPTQPGPSCFYSFVFLHFSEEQRGARALLCTSGSPRDHDDPELPMGSVETRLPVPILPRGAPGSVPPTC